MSESEIIIVNIINFAGLPHQASDVHHEGGRGLYRSSDGRSNYQIQRQSQEEQTVNEK